MMNKWKLPMLLYMAIIQMWELALSVFDVISVNLK